MSFITPPFVERAGLVLCQLDKVIEVSSPLGSKILTDSGVRGCVISFGGHELVADLILLDVGEFDVILGMEWLSEWHATLDCFAKRVCFRPPGQTEFCYQGERDSVVRSYVSAVRAERMIRQGCEAYLVFVLTEPEGSETRIEDVPII